MNTDQQYKISSASEHELEAIWQILEMVVDPEVPVLSILDLGIVREVKFNDDQVEIVVTPTYTGCPAMDVISMGSIEYGQFCRVRRKV